MHNDYLMHFRTKGSKNGKRLYQNKDGSLTPAGRLRYLKNPSEHRGDRSSGFTNEERNKKLKKMSDDELKNINARDKLEATYKSNHKSTEEQYNEHLMNFNKNVESGFKSGKDLERTINNIRYNKKNAEYQKLLTDKIKNMSNDELQKQVTRMNLEQQYARLSSSSISRGKTTVSDILDIVGSIVGIAGGTAGAIVAIKSIKNIK